MSRCYLGYRFRLKEPLILSDGSQMGNILTTQGFVPGSTILGLCAGMYLRQNLKNGATPDTAHTCPEFRSLFLSEKTIFSPAYPVANETEKCIPMPFSVFGCKYYGFNSPKPRGRRMHGIFDCLYNDVPKTCPAPLCDDPVEHKTGYIYFDREAGPCSYEISKRIITHNRVAESSNDKGLFSFEAIAEGGNFYGEISFSDKAQRETLFNLLVDNPVARLGKARRRGYGRVEIDRPIKHDDTVRKPFGNTSLSDDGVFSIYLSSDAVVLDSTLNYCSRLDSDILAPLLGIRPGELEVYPLEAGATYKSFWKNGILLGFNEKRRMPLPMERTILRGSVFTVRYKGNGNIGDRLEYLLEEGLGTRRNEGFGQVIINLRTHQQQKKIEGLKDA